MTEPVTVVDDPTSSRLEATLNGHRAELVYRRDDDRMVLVHTEVPEALSGHGVGAALVRAAVDLAAREALTIEPACSYARWWLQQHPEVAARATIVWPPE